MTRKTFFVTLCAPLLALWPKKVVAKPKVFVMDWSKLTPELEKRLIEHAVAQRERIRAKIAAGQSAWYGKSFYETLGA